MTGHRKSEYPMHQDAMDTGNAGTLFGVGVGPGSPDLMTLRAVEVLKRVAHVLAPSTSLESPGRAELTVRAIIPGISVERFAFPMSTTIETAVEHRADGKPTADRQPMEQVYSDVAQVITEYTANCKDVAFITIGDPDIYSTFTRLRQRVLEIRPDCTVETIPGICAFQELAARTNTTLSAGDEHLTIIAHLRNADALSTALSDAHQSVVVYKGGTRLPEIASAVEKAGRTHGSVLGVHLGQEGEYICGIDEAPPQPTPYLSTLIVPPVRGRE